MIDAALRIRTQGTDRTVSLASYLDPDAEESAHRQAYLWIKELRHARIDGRAFRQRFTVRGDSLWWFTEIYLHKEQAVLDVYRAVAAANTLIEQERPTELRIGDASAVVRHVVTQVARARRVASDSGVTDSEWSRRLRRIHRRARALAVSAWASRLRGGEPPRTGSPAVAAFIHRAFWRAGAEDGSAESYIGPVLKAVERRAGPGGVSYVGVGPPVSFRARGWWRRVTPAAGAVVVPVERYAPWNALRDSRELWRARSSNLRLLLRSEDLRDAAAVGGVDCWPILREQLAGIALLQWPWSARAMDEAAAALDALRPSSVVTYAEAGGWGRAIILETRRRGIPSAGLQHGFIYRHWLNYLHEQDELQPASRSDAGFPAPTLTVLFDDYAARHLRQHGRLTPESLKVAGSPRLDALVASLAAIDPAEVTATRRNVGAKNDEMVVLVTTKEKEAREVLPALVNAAGSIPGVRMVIKPHPAETVDVYRDVASASHVVVMPPSAPLGTLLAASRAVVTVNSTVALDAAVLDIPALVIGLPNNLSPFVEAGALAGAATPGEIARQLHRVLYDEGFRQQLSAARREFLAANAIRSDGMAAERSADAVLGLTARAAVSSEGKGN